jgi:hypothetical protein
MTTDDKPIVTVIPAAPGFRYVTLWWEAGNPNVTEQPIIAWRVTTELLTNRNRSALMGCSTPTTARTPRLSIRAGHVTIVEHAAYASVEDWIKERRELRREAA